MKAFLLSAGIGSRLRPITDHTPKCMVDIDGRPLLDIWLDALDEAGVDEVLVNVHHHADRVLDHIRFRTRGPAVRTSYEASLLGSAGTLRAHRAWIIDEQFFLAFNADNLTNFDVRDLIAFHASGDAIATVTAFRSPHPESGGVIELDPHARVVGFEEKPPVPRSNLVNAGMYAFDPIVLDEIGDAATPDIGYDLLPRLVNRARALVVDDYFRDIGTIDAYTRACADWPERAVR
jgi:mannose-1-phosphate guanylyltransferase